jgi:hypothetical protein
MGKRHDGESSAHGGLGVHWRSGANWDPRLWHRRTRIVGLASSSGPVLDTVGTGKAIKTAAQEHDLGGNLAEQTREFKNRSNSWLMLAMMAVMTTFIVGGGVATRVLPPWVHSSLFMVTLAIQVWTLVIEGRVLGENERLMRQVDRQVKSLDTEGGAS